MEVKESYYIFYAKYRTGEPVPGLNNLGEPGFAHAAILVVLRVCPATPALLVSFENKAGDMYVYHGAGAT
jgi:hypothetical protein